MANPKRKAVKAQPISSNPLFPAVVALWFGALFGLGSLAVRPALLEQLVLNSHIDLVIPAAAPPLGLTARILLALVMAGLGVVLGIILTRRLNRPTEEQHERKRGARDLQGQAPRLRPRDAHPDAPARRPISAHEELGLDDDARQLQTPPMGPGMLANRRRALAIVEQEQQFVPQDLAPLPGEVSSEATNLPALAQPLPHSASEYVIPLSADPATPATPLDWSSVTPVAPATSPIAAPAMIAAQRQMFQPDAQPPLATEPDMAQAAHRAGRQVFGMTPTDPPAETPRQIFGIAADGDHVSQDFVKAAGFQTSVFDTPVASALFARGDDAAPIPAEPLELAAELEARPMPAPVYFVPPVAVPAATPVAAPISSIGQPAAEPLPNPASLGMTDLAARLAESMRRRRARGTAGPGQAVPLPPGPAALLAELPALPAAFAPPVAAVPAPIPEVHTPPAIGALTAVAPEPASLGVALPEPVQPVPAQLEPALPRLAAPDDFAGSPTATAALTMPAAMRPLALDAFLEDDAAFDESVLPPRSIVMAAPVAAAAPDPAPALASAPAGLTLDEDEPAEDNSYGATGDANPYASLAGMAAPRAAFVRIEEYDIDPSEAIEPVVIFPGQAPHAAAFAGPADGPSALQADDVFRRFDAPALAGQGQPVAASTAMPTVDSAESERALRAALSNLQRMSGAA